MLDGTRLRHLRILHGITVKGMAAAIGKSDRWVRALESCKEIPSEEIYRDWLDTVYGKKKIPKTKE